MSVCIQTESRASFLEECTAKEAVGVELEAAMKNIEEAREEFVKKEQDFQVQILSSVASCVDFSAESSRNIRFFGRCF